MMRFAFALLAVIAVASSLLAGAPADPAAVSGCHGAKASCHGAAEDVGCHGATAPSCHGDLERGCHGKSRSTFPQRRASRVEARAKARADRSEARATRAGLKARAASCHGTPEPAAECDCGDACDCR